MASSDEYQQRRSFDNKELKRIDGGVDGRKTWKVAGTKNSDTINFMPHIFFNAVKDLNIEEKLKTK
jgi:hypothetical protein